MTCFTMRPVPSTTSISTCFARAGKRYVSSAGGAFSPTNASAGSFGLVNVLTGDYCHIRYASRG
jgi:hypothetical protein